MRMWHKGPLRVGSRPNVLGLCHEGQSYRQIIHADRIPNIHGHGASPESGFSGSSKSANDAARQRYRRQRALIPNGAE